jgi:flagella basal body P-ring formation protein FlgA
VLTDADVTQAEVDWAEDPSATFQKAELAVGRTLARAVQAGQAVRQSHLRARQWFAAGDVVKVMARGAGFAVAGSGQALTHGIEGQPARVRTESGQVLTGLPVADRQLELSM